MEIIQLPGYTEEEKLEIAKRYLVKRQLDANGLDSSKAEITEEALKAIIRDYTREAGVRTLEREIGAVLRSVAMKIAERTSERVVVSEKDLHSILGARRFESELAERTSVPGVATGLAWTSVGGDILFIEASRTPGSGKLILTGQLGEVMKESAQAALTLAKVFTLADPGKNGHPHPRSGGRDAEGRPERGRGDVPRAGFAAGRQAGARGRRHDPARSRCAGWCCRSAG
jgi:ATP-dependent Lon protease